MTELRVDDLSVTLHGRPVVTKVSFRVGPGERVCLLGASGSGKSVTARVIVGQVLPGMSLSGDVVVAGRSVLGRPPSRRAASQRVAMMFQDSAVALHPSIPLGRQLGATLRRQGLAAATARRRAETLMTEVGLDFDAMQGRVPGQLSGGQRQRVCLAMALASGADVLVADEPTTALDAVAQARVIDLLCRQLGREAALLFITHDLAVATAVCERAIMLERGRVVEEGPLPDLLWAGVHPCTRRLSRAAYASCLPTTVNAANAAEHR